MVVLYTYIYSVSFFIYRVVRQTVAETYANDDYYDVTFVVIVFISFLPSVFTPWFFVHWILIGQIKTKGMRNILFHSSKSSRNGNAANPQNGMRRETSRRNESKIDYSYRKIKITYFCIISEDIYYIINWKLIWHH